eukprot:sb/3462840/
MSHTYDDVIIMMSQEPNETSKQPIRAHYLVHVIGYQPIRDQYFLIRSVPDDEPNETSKQPIRAHYLVHVIGYQPIRDQYFLIRSVPDDEPNETSKQPIRAHYLVHVIGYQPIRDQYFLIRSVPDDEPNETSKQPIRAHYLVHVIGYQPIRDQYFLIRSVPDDAGVQIGSTCWELYLMEHGLTSEGYQVNAADDEKSNMMSLFSETSKGHYVPRSLFVDFEPTVIDTIRQGEFKKLYNPEFMVTGKEDSSDNYARGYYSIGRMHIENAESKYRRLAENCDSLQGILLFRSYGGGTGSGFSSLLVERIQDSLGKKCKLEFAIYPSPAVSTSIVEPYNSILTPHLNDVCFMMDNEAVFDLCREKLAVEWPNYYNLNRLVAQAVSSFTGSLRFDGSLNVDLNEFQTNLAGVQIGSTCWELYLMEHGLTSEGYQVNAADDEKSNMLSLFSETSKGHYVPRSLFVDFEPTVIDTIRQGEFKKLYNPEFMVTGKEDSSDNYARGYYSIGRMHIENAESKYRRLAENCDSLQGILLFRSYGGGTGSGFSSLLVERIQDSLGKKCKLEFAIYPSPAVSTSIVEPYNSILTPHLNDVCFMMDNEAVFDLCREKLAVEWPNYYNLNRLVAQAVSSFTGSLRFDGSLNVDLNEFQTNLVRTHHMA